MLRGTHTGFYLIGMWYKRSEAQRRFSFFFSSTTLAGAFGGLLASAIGKMSGMRGYRGWRWIFILEGTLTCLVAFIFYFVIPDFPEDAKWLGEEERAYVKARLRADQGRSAAERKITVRDVGNVFKDFKIFVGGFMYFGLIVPAYGLVLHCRKTEIATNCDIETAVMRSSRQASSKHTVTPRSARNSTRCHLGLWPSASR